MSITAKELARELGLSRGAVSLALNGKPGVSEATRLRVLTEAKRQGFDFSRLTGKPSAGVKRAGTVYFIIYKRHGTVVADTPFFSALSEGVDTGCKKLGLYLRVTYLYSSDNVREELSRIRDSGCAGILLLGTEMAWEDYLPFRECGIPLVLADTYFERATSDCVLINNVQGAYIATAFLIERFRCQPGYLRSSYAINNFSERADGFYKAVRESGMSTSRSLAHRLTPSVEGAYADMLALLNQGERPARCYFADNDLIAAGAMKALQERGISVPQEVAVVGFDDLPVSLYSAPPLTTIHVAKQAMGELAVRQLCARMENAAAMPVKLEVSTKLIKRGST